MTFLAVVEGDGGGWRVYRDGLTDAIRARWSGVEIDSTQRSEVRSLIWQFETENGPGEAYLHEDGSCLYMDVWLRPVAVSWGTRTAWTRLVTRVVEQRSLRRRRQDLRMAIPKPAASWGARRQAPR